MPSPISGAPSPIKASFAFVLIHFVLFIGIFVMSFMFDNTSATFKTAEFDTILGNFRLFSNFTLAVAVPTAAVNILGLLACIYWDNRHHFSGLIVSYTVFEAFLCALSFICGIVLFVFSAFTKLACVALSQICDSCNWNEGNNSNCCPITRQGYNATCSDFSPILNTVAILCFVNAAIALASSITGCVSAGSEKSKNSSHPYTTMTVITYN